MDDTDAVRRLGDHLALETARTQLRISELVPDTRAPPRKLTPKQRRMRRDLVAWAVSQNGGD